MSQENVEIVKAAIDAFNREDRDAMGKDAAPGFELDFSRAAGLWSGVFDRNQLQEMWVDIHRNWDSAWVEPHEFIEAGAIRNGAIERVTMYQERAEALEAVGLSE